MRNRCQAVLAIMIGVLVVFDSLLLGAPSNNKLIINADQGKQTISKYIYGHFSEHLGHCIYGGIWVGENSSIPNTRGIRNDVVQALRNIKIPVLRWPGGCFADEYHWKDGVGPREQRPSIVNTHWGGVTENNHFGTHEFLDLCSQLGCEPYICGNVGSGAIQEMQQWVEYVTFDGQSPMADWRRKNGRQEPWKLRFFGVGNENWGCGGNMRPEFYSDLYRRFQTYVRNFAGNQIYKIASGANSADYRWTEVLMKEAGPIMSGLSLHHYTVPGGWEQKVSATQFGEKEWFETLKMTLFMDELIRRHSSLMDQYDPQKRVGLIVDEWGTWYQVEPGTNPGFLYQQNTLRDALAAATNLNIFNQHADRVFMANIAQMINVLQAVIFTREGQIVLTPTYHVFDLYRVHQAATLLPTELQSLDYIYGGEKIPALNASASQDKEGKIHVTLCNLNPNQTAEVSCQLRGQKVSRISGKVLTAKSINAHNTFDKPDLVKLEDFTGAKLNNGGWEASLPAKSVVLLEMQ